MRWASGLSPVVKSYLSFVGFTGVVNNISIAWEPFGIFTVPGVSQTPRCCQLFIVKNFRFWLQTAWKYRAHYPVHKSVYVEKRLSSSSKTCLRSLTSLKLFFTIRVIQWELSQELIELIICQTCAGLSIRWSGVNDWRPALLPAGH